MENVSKIRWVADTIKSIASTTRPAKERDSLLMRLAEDLREAGDNLEARLSSLAAHITLSDSLRQADLTEYDTDQYVQRIITLAPFEEQKSLEGKPDYATSVAVNYFEKYRRLHDTDRELLDKVYDNIYSGNTVLKLYDYREQYGSVSMPVESFAEMVLEKLTDEERSRYDGDIINAAAQHVETWWLEHGSPEEERQLRQLLDVCGIPYNDINGLASEIISKVALKDVRAMKREDTLAGKALVCFENWYLTNHPEIVRRHYAKLKEYCGYEDFYEYPAIYYMKQVLSLLTEDERAALPKDDCLAAADGLQKLDELKRKKQWELWHGRPASAEDEGKARHELTTLLELHDLKMYDTPVYARIIYGSIPEGLRLTMSTNTYVAAVDFFSSWLKLERKTQK
jgi:hypothetical protein